MIGVDYALIDANASPDWEQARGHTGLSFAIIRAGWGTSSDPTWKRDRIPARAAGVTVGPFLAPQWPRPGMPKPPSPADQAQAFVRNIGMLDNKDLPPAVDVEFNTNLKVETGMEPADVVDWVTEFNRVIVESYGTQVMVYTSRRVWVEVLLGVEAPELADCPLWVKSPYLLPARRAPFVANDNVIPHPPIPAPWGNAYTVQQYQGDAIGFPGFTSTVDVNLFNVVSYGCSGDQVALIQRRLGLVCTGKFDGTTKDAVVSLQQKTGLSQDGVVGPKTFAALSWLSSC
jgi:GH25 family lysozyme M1 (1,4-beta-N-acetylmuramidase)